MDQTRTRAVQRVQVGESPEKVIRVLGFPGLYLQLTYKIPGRRLGLPETRETKRASSQTAISPGFTVQSRIKLLSS